LRVSINSLKNGGKWHSFLVLLASLLQVNLSLSKRSSRSGIGIFLETTKTQKHNLMGIINYLDVTEGSSGLISDEIGQRKLVRMIRLKLF